MFNDFGTKKRSNKTLSAITLIILMSAPFLAYLQTANAQSSNVEAPNTVGAFRYPQGVTNNSWTVSMYSNEANALTPSSGPMTNHTLWIAKIPAKAGIVVSNGRIYAYDHSYMTNDLTYEGMVNTLTSADAYTGEVIWSQTAQVKGYGAGDSAPVLDTGNQFDYGLLYAFINGSLRCFSARDGTLLWEVTREQMTAYLGGPLQATNLVSLGPLSQNYIYFLTGEENGHVWAVDKRLGRIAWSTDINGSLWVMANIALSDDRLYVGDYNGVMHSLNATTGKSIWTTQASGAFVYTSAVADGKVYSGTTDGNVWSLDGITGKILWKTYVGGRGSGGVGWNPVINAGKVFIGSTDGNLSCLDASNGDIKWKFPIVGAIHGISLADGNVYVQSTAAGFAGLYTNVSLASAHPGKVSCISQVTGQLLWEYTLPPGVSVVMGNLPVVDGIAYSGSYDENVYAFGMGPTTTEVSVTDANVAKGTTIAVSGRVYDESPASPGAPVANVPVKIQMQKMADNSWSDVGSTTTDSMGHFASQWTPSAEGTYTLIANFNGTNDYAWSRSTTIVQVNPESPSRSTNDIWYIVIVAGVVIAIIIALASFLAIWKLRK